MDFVVTCAEQVNAKVPFVEMPARLMQVWREAARQDDPRGDRTGACCG